MRTIRQDKEKSTLAFTLLEVMIAISIFGLLLLYASQFMRTEMRVFDTETKQNEVEQKARVAMMHILDEARLHNFTFYKSDSSSQGIYRYANAAAAGLKDETDSTCLVFISSSASVTPPSSTKVFFDKAEGELYYLKNDSQYLIADDISHLSLEGDGSLVKIEITVGENDAESYQLQSWVRLN